MPDWRGYVRQRLPRLACSPEREAEVVEEIALQLHDIYTTARCHGASASEAEAAVHDEIRDWRALARDLQLAEHPVLATPSAVAVHRLEPAMREFRVGQHLVELVRDARISVLALLARPLFALTTIGTFAVGIGATALVFSVVHAVLLSPLPYREPDRLTFVQQVIPEIADRVPVLGVNPRSFTAWEGSCRATCERMAALVASTTTLTGLGEPEGVTGAKISAALFDVLGVTPMLGRAFTREEDVPGRNRVAIVTHGFWQRRFAGDPAVIGRVIVLDSVAVEIVGVLPATFRLPELPQLSVPSRVGDRFEVFRPLAWSDDLRRSWGEYDNIVIVRRPAGVSVHATEAELTAITRAEYERAQIHPYAVATPLIAALTADSRRALWLLLGAVAAALLIACVNVAGLLGTRWTARQRELAIRTAIGASRSRLAQLVAIESVLLSTAGGVLVALGAPPSTVMRLLVKDGLAIAIVGVTTGLIAASLATPFLSTFLAGVAPRDAISFSAVAAVLVLTALAASYGPARRGMRLSPTDALRGD